MFFFSILKLSETLFLACKTEKVVPIAMLCAVSDSGVYMCVFGSPTLQARVCSKGKWAWLRDQVWMLGRLEEEGSGGDTCGD